MKRLLVLLLFVPFLSFSQNWPAESAEWHYCVTLLPAGQIGTQTYAYTDDVVINDTSYSVIRPIAYDGEPYSLEQAELDHRVTLVRQSGDTIYRRVADKEYVFFVNGLDIGGTFTTFRSASAETNLVACLEDLVLEVIDVQFEEYGGSEYRTVLLRDQNVAEVYDSEPVDPIEYTFVEGIGLLTNFPYYWDFGFADSPFPPSETCSPSSDGNGDIDLSQYSDSEKNFDIGTCQPTGLMEIIVGQLEIYPNPSSDHITIRNVRLSPNSIYSIYNDQGRLVDQSVLKSFTIDVTQLGSGIYSIIVEDSSKGNYLGRVVVP